MGSAAKQTILCVDDDKRNLELLEALLSLEEYDLRFAESGAGALAEVAREVPDLILLDIMMPGMSGLEVLTELRSNERTRLIPVVLLTALRDEEDRIKGIEAGCDDFISKPFDKLELSARVRSLLKISFYRRSLAEKEKFAHVMEQIPNGLVILNPSLKIEQFNRKAKAWLGFAGQGSDLVVFLEQNFKLDHAGDLRKDLPAGDLRFEAERIETEKERPLILGVSTGVIKNPAGEITDIIVLMQDVTEAKRKEFQELDFLDLIAHKLRTPMTVLGGNMELLQSGMAGPVTQGQEDIIKVLARKSLEIDRDFDKLIGFVAVRRPGNLSATGRIRVKERLMELARKTEKTDGLAELSLKVLCPETLELSTNEFAFSLMLQNLLENAAKFNSRQRKEISVEAGSLDSGIFIKVRDNGDGIPGEDIEKIYDAFYQVDKHRTGNVPGYGVGLAIVRRFAQSLGVTVSVESEIGKGSTFMLIFPASEAGRSSL